MKGFLPYPTSDQQLICENAQCFEELGLRIWFYSMTPGMLDLSSFVTHFKSDGITAFADLNAGVSLLVKDLDTGQCSLAIDRMGIESLCFAATESGLYFARDADQVSNRLEPHLRGKISRQSVYEYLFFHSVPAPGSIFSGVQKLVPGQVLTVEHGGKPLLRHYWRPTFSDTAKDVDETRTALRDVLSGAVANAYHAAGSGKVGAFLSGGLDSSSVVGFFTEQQSNAPTFSIGFDVDGYDERSYARIANNHFGANGHEYVAGSDDVLEHFETIAKAYDEPFGNSSVVPTLLCAHLARQHGIDLLLAGDGGDELFAGNERYAKQKVFEWYFRLPGSLRRGFFDPLAARIPEDVSLMPLKKFRSYVDQANVKLPRRFETWNYAYREGIASMLETEFASEINIEAPFERMQSVYDANQTGDSVDRMLTYDWKFTLADSDLRKVNRMCEIAGVNVAFPMLDATVVDFSTGMFGREKLKGLKLRSFYKNAMQDFLPQEILNKPKHGFGMPFGIWLKEQPELADMVYGRLQALKMRGIFRSTFIDQLIEDQKQGHASYFGFFLWDLAMLEAWFDHKGVSV